jgi:hypothetical protein
MSLYLNNERYLAALYRQRDRIIAGEAFVAEDCDVVGAKSTHASWGLCSKDRGAWPDAEDHLWPDQFEAHGRVAPKYRNEHQSCPMQKKGGGTGCFYSCRIFKTGEINAKTRQKAIELYEQRIAKARAAALATRTVDAPAGRGA